MSQIGKTLKTRTANIFICSAIAVICGLLYFVPYSNMLKLWGNEDFAYCYFVPLIAAYLVWEKRRELDRVPSVPSWSGFAVLLPGIALYWLGELGGEYYALSLSSWLVLVGLLWMYLGWNKLKQIAFPMLFLLAMFPLPNVVYSNMSFKLKLLSSQIGVAMIRLAGLTAFREGNKIDLGFTQLQVVDACSGLRYLIPLLLLGLLLAYHFNAARWKKAVLVISTIPLTVLTNSLRIASVGFLYQFWGAAVAEGFFHDFSGWLIFMVSLALLLGEMWLLRRIGGASPAEQSFNIQSGDNVGSRFSWQMIAVVTILLLGTLGASRTLDFREKVPIARPLQQFPMTVGEWQGARFGLNADLLASLHLSDYLMAEYRNPQGKVVSIYVAYNDSQRKGESSHSPASCLPGNGWSFEESGVVTTPGAAGLMTVRRAFIQKSGDRMLVYYWFPQRGRILTSMVQLKLYAFLDALTVHRTDGALVRLITPVENGEPIELAERRLKEFVQLSVPALNTFIPGSR
ncbi:transmembrane exosortase [Geobacter sp. OR-1]|uniref:VPLPA-CTERM-specific exosortase XrtD n=1 Tax=Geobacter sp. OR-1 TaxID=1266765 RepID=UPI000542B34A|nr:VPLPA-CTERM-specific exosortase XrtD [Geobacter sp. OR-1]GAM10715.1 transmembrane exosortase [Geobacter sp. OR-1]